MFSRITGRQVSARRGNSNCLIPSTNQHQLKQTEPKNLFLLSSCDSQIHLFIYMYDKVAVILGSIKVSIQYEMTGQPLPTFLTCQVASKSWHQSLELHIFTSPSCCYSLGLKLFSNRFWKITTPI